MRIVMLAGNDWLDDSRIIREAESLARHGHAVYVLCAGRVAEASSEHRAGVTYHRVPMGQPSLPVKARAVRVHFAIVLLGASSVRGVITTIPAVLASILSLAVAALMCCVAPIERVLGRLVKRLTVWPRRLFRYLAQPFVHLDGLAARYLDTIVQLKPEVVHAHDAVTLSAGVLAARKVRCRFVYDSHELETRTRYQGINRWTTYWVARYEKILSRRANAVVTVSDSIAGWLAREYGIERPVVLFNAPAGRSPVLTPAPPGEQLRTKLGLSADTPLVVHVGWVTVERGLDLCVRALAELPAVHFAMVGPRHADTETAVLQTAHELELEDRVHLVDPVPHDEVMRFISSADCSVIAIQNTSLNNNFCFPNKLLDSVLAGLPVAVSNLVELRCFVLEHQVGVVMDESDPRSIAAAIKTLLGQREQYRPSAVKVSEIERRYGWAAQEQKLLRLYRTLVPSGEEPWIF